MPLPPESRLIRKLTDKVEAPTYQVMAEVFAREAGSIDLADLVLAVQALDVGAINAALEALATAVAAEDAGAESAARDALALAVHPAELSMLVDTAIGQLTISLTSIFWKVVAQGGGAAAPLVAERVGIEPVNLEGFRSRAVATAREVVGDLVTGIVEQQRLAIAEAVSRGFGDGLSPIQIARSLRGSVGLDARRAAGFDRYLADLAANPPDLGEVALQREIDREYQRRLDSRLNSIAATESTRLAEETMGDLYEQAVEDGQIDPARWGWKWICAPGACPRCLPLSGIVVPFGGVFPGGYTAPPIHPWDRCGRRAVRV